MTTAIYIRSQKGIGKSCIIDFLRKSVLGSEVIYQTSDSNILSGRFNGPLQGKMLFVLEEAPYYIYMFPYFIYFFLYFFWIFIE